MKALPTTMKKRDLLYGTKGDSATFLALAKKYEEAGSLSDAVDFYAKAADASALGRLKGRFVEEGDAFLLSKLAHLDHASVEDEDFEHCAAKAEELGKTRYAILAYKRLENEDKVEALKETISEDGDIVAERESETFVAANLEEIQDLDEDEED